MHHHHKRMISDHVLRDLNGQVLAPGRGQVGYPLASIQFLDSPCRFCSVSSGEKRCAKLITFGTLLILNAKLIGLSPRCLEAAKPGHGPNCAAERPSMTKGSEVRPLRVALSLQHGLVC